MTVFPIHRHHDSAAVSLTPIKKQFNQLGCPRKKLKTENYYNQCNKSTWYYGTISPENIKHYIQLNTELHTESMVIGCPTAASNVCHSWLCNIYFPFTYQETCNCSSLAGLKSRLNSNLSSGHYYVMYLIIVRYCCQ